MNRDRAPQEGRGHGLGDKLGKGSHKKSRPTDDESVDERLSTYALLSRWGAQLGFPKGYLGKIVLVVFAGTHMSLIVFVVYLLLAQASGRVPTPGALALRVELLHSVARERLR